MEKIEPKEYYILIDKIPVPAEDVWEWADWVEEHESEWNLTETKAGNAIVKTIFLGAKGQFFITVVKGGVNNDLRVGAPTWAQAEAVHDAICAAEKMNLHFDV